MRSIIDPHYDIYVGVGRILLNQSQNFISLKTVVGEASSLLIYLISKAPLEQTQKVCKIVQGVFFGVWLEKESLLVRILTYFKGRK